MSDIALIPEFQVRYEAISPKEGQIPLTQKLLPLHESDPKNEPLVVIRGEYDVSLLKKKVLDPNSIVWDQAHQAKSNVQIVRPAHDNWGIGKIVFKFCDDFMLKTVNLPWSTDPEWKGILDGIYRAIGIEERQVIRCLIASMPAGATIPVHHDTGLWVKHSHRIHLAISTGDEVDFLVGYNTSCLEKYTFAEGKIIELNNQAKHAVINRMDRPRLHLIFDYVESDFIAPPLSILPSHWEAKESIRKELSYLQNHHLSPGAKIYQTRRSIDLSRGAEGDNGLNIPKFVVIGAQKSGTTSLYELIMQHGLAVKGKRRESHYFDWFYKSQIGVTNPDDLDTPETIEKCRSNYSSFYPIDQLKKHPSLFTGESTPSYLLHNDIVIPRMKKIVPWTKLLAIVRNPVDRAFSHFQMSVDVTGSPEQMKVRGLSLYMGKTFEQVIEEEINELKALGIDENTPADEFQKKYLSNRPLGHGGHSVISRGLYHLQLAPWLMEYTLNTDLMVLELKDIQGDHATVQKTMNIVFDFLGLPHDDIHDIQAKNTRSYAAMKPETRETLSAFYRPYNRKLFELIGREFSW